jgi:hypothetical protein
MNQWKNINNRKQTLNLKVERQDSQYIPGLLKGVAKEIAKYKLHYTVLVNFRLYRVGTEWAVEF